MGSAHGLKYVVPSTRRATVVAVCDCGWKTPEYLTSGLAESLLDAHAQRERARSTWIESSLMRIETRQRRATAIQERAAFKSVLMAIKSVRPHSVDPAKFALRTVVTVESDVVVRDELAEALESRGGFYLVGQADTAVEAIAITVVERPGLVVVGEKVPDFAEMGGADLVHDLSPDTAVCVYGESALPGTDLLVSRDLPVNDLVRRLAQLAS